MKSNTILYIDDDKDDRDIFIEVLKNIRPNIECKLANDGMQGLMLLRKIDPPLCIYLDINMPVMDGLEVLRELKNDVRFRGIPTFMLTTSQNPMSEEAARMLGAAAYLKKPNSYSEYTQLLNTCFAEHVK